MNSLSPKRIHVFLLIAHGRVWLLMYLHQQTPCSGGAETWPVIQTMAECEWRVDQLWLEADLTLVSALWSAKRNCQQSSQMFPIGNFNFRTSNKIMRNSVCRMVKKIVFLFKYFSWFIFTSSSCPKHPPVWVEFCLQRTHCALYEITFGAVSGTSKLQTLWFFTALYSSSPIAWNYSSYLRQRAGVLRT